MDQAKPNVRSENTMVCPQGLETIFLLVKIFHIAYDYTIIV